MYLVKTTPMFDIDYAETLQIIYEFGGARSVYKFKNEVKELFDNIGQFPEMYMYYLMSKKAVERGYRFATVGGKYLIFYKVDDDAKLVTAVRLLNGRRNIDTLL